MINIIDTVYSMGKDKSTPFDKGYNKCLNLFLKSCNGMTVYKILNEINLYNNNDKDEKYCDGFKQAYTDLYEIFKKNHCLNSIPK